jgi:adenosine 3'-phospho 5'-phosphosulfate transporter B2
MSGWGGRVYSLYSYSPPTHHCTHPHTLHPPSHPLQLFIFHTIKRFGPLIFTLVMTARQMISILVSSLVLPHFPAYFPGAANVLTQRAAGAAALVFATLLFKARRNYNASLASKAKKA